MSDAAIASASPASPRAPVRPFYWSVRRELWENRAIYLAPLIVAGVVMLGFLFSLRALPHAIRVLGAPLAPDAPAAEHRAHGLQAMAVMAPQAGILAILVAALIVGIFYCLASLHSERRDRSVLFWKSLPVSDTTTVLSKAFIPLVVLPPIVVTVMVVTQLIMAALATAVVAASGLDPAVLWHELTPTPVVIVGLAYGVVMLTLWNAPIIGWLMLVSAWAKRMTFVWAVAPPLVICLFEFLAFHTHYAWTLVHSRLVDGLAAFTAGGRGKAAVSQLSDIDPTPFLTDPGFWGGLVFAAAALAACVWLRRRREPI
jgi:ABC-2 type transport system permease protein